MSHIVTLNSDKLSMNGVRMNRRIRKSNFRAFSKTLHLIALNLQIKLLGLSGNEFIHRFQTQQKRLRKKELLGFLVQTETNNLPLGRRGKRERERSAPQNSCALVCAVNNESSPPLCFCARVPVTLSACTTCSIWPSWPLPCHSWFISQ